MEKKHLLFIFFLCNFSMIICSESKIFSELSDEASCNSDSEYTPDDDSEYTPDDESTDTYDKKRENPFFLINKKKDVKRKKVLPKKSSKKKCLKEIIPNTCTRSSKKEFFTINNKKIQGNINHLKDVLFEEPPIVNTNNSLNQNKIEITSLDDKKKKNDQRNTILNIVRNHPDFDNFFMNIDDHDNIDDYPHSDLDNFFMNTHDHDKVDIQKLIHDNPHLNKQDMIKLGETLRQQNYHTNLRTLIEASYKVYRELNPKDNFYL